MKRALVTGASRGIGKAIAECLHAHNYDVLTPTRTQLDLTQPDHIDAFIATHPNIDIVINNAGINPIQALCDISDKNIHDTQTINTLAPLKLIQKIVPHMKQNKWGRIINISSIYASLGRAGRVNYGISKGGIEAMTRHLAIELAESNITVNAIAPGFIDTELTRQNNPPHVLEKLIEVVPSKQLGSVTDIANTVLFLCQTRFITGQTITVDGGFSIA